MDYKICQCFSRWGEESQDCEIGFVARRPNEQFCDPCKQVAVRARVRHNVAMHRIRQQTAKIEFDITRPDWKASWIDRVCTCCGRQGVPTFNRYLCIRCWQGHSDEAYVLHLDDEMERIPLEYNEEPSEVIVYDNNNFTQRELWEKVRQCRKGWTQASEIWVSERLRSVFVRMGFRPENY